MLLLQLFDLDEKYVIRWVKETGYAIVLAVLGLALSILSETDVNAVQDWQTWLVTFGMACGRVAWATLTNALRSLLGGGGHDGGGVDAAAT